jgi:hypothetical protein
MPTLTTRTAHEILLEDGINISATKINHMLKELGMKYGRAIPKPILSEINKEKRLQFCYENKRNSFKNVIFSDESMFSMDSGHLYVWYKEHYEKFVIEQKGTQNYRVHVWGAISRDKKSRLHIWRENVNAQIYISCLNQELLSILPQNKFKRIFQQDNAASHKAKLTMEWLDQNDIRTIDHPTKP